MIRRIVLALLLVVAILGTNFMSLVHGVERGYAAGVADVIMSIMEQQGQAPPPDQEAHHPKPPSHGVFAPPGNIDIRSINRVSSVT